MRARGAHRTPRRSGRSEPAVTEGTTEGRVRLWASYHPDDCAAGRSFLALMPGLNGASPIATVPLVFESS